MSEKEKRKQQNRKYYLANSDRWKKYRQIHIEKSAAIVKKQLKERGDPGHD